MGEQIRRALLLILMPPSAARDAVRAIVADAGWHATYVAPRELVQLPDGAWNVVVIGASLLDASVVRLTVAVTRDPQTRVLVVGEDADPQRIADVLQAGADDYVLYPFAPEECLARLRSLVMHSQRRVRPISRLGLTLDDQRRVVGTAVSRVRLANREWDVLETLVNRNGKAVSTDELSQAVWGSLGNDHALTSTIHRIRKKLASYGIDSIDIVTVRGTGYMARVREPVGNRHSSHDLSQ